MAKPELNAVEEILARMRVPEEKGMFVIGCFERPATLYMQQVCALNLIYALDASRRLKGRVLAVIGGGPAGLTAAAAAASRGALVTVLERIETDVLSLAGSVTNRRWLHPHIYDWPKAGTEEPSTNLGVLDWSAGPADKVIDHLRKKWKLLERELRIETHLGATEISVSPLDDQYLIHWNGGGPRNPVESSGQWGLRAGKRLRNLIADVVILAVGFGVEERTPGFDDVASYWKTDSIDQYRDGDMRPPPSCSSQVPVTVD